MSISQSASRCIQLLETQPDTISAQLQQDLENTLVRFKIWAGNVGVFGLGTASIDYRLRNKSEVLGVLLVLLDRLRELLEKAILQLDEEEIIENEEERPENEDGSIILKHRSDSSDSSDSSSMLSFDAEESSNSLEVTQDTMTKANAIVSELYHLSSILETPVDSDDILGVKSLVTKELDMVEREEQRKFASDIRFIIQDHHSPKAPKALIERLVSTIIFRNMMIIRRQRHHAELARDPTRVSELPAHVLASMTNTPGGAHIPMKKNEGVVSSIQGTDVHASGANTSFLDAGGLANYAELVALPGITSPNAARRRLLEVPLLSDNVDERTQNVLCPYCFRSIDKYDTNEPRWT